jgi:sec-independent protein translocase protein TatA
MNFGVGELIIILVIVLVLFGAGRISGIGTELGSAIRNFRDGLSDGQEKTETTETTEESQS